MWSRQSKGAFQTIIVRVVVCHELLCFALSDMGYEGVLFLPLPSPFSGVTVHLEHTCGLPMCRGVFGCIVTLEKIDCGCRFFSVICVHCKGVDPTLSQPTFFSLDNLTSPLEITTHYQPRYHQSYPRLIIDSSPSIIAEHHRRPSTIPD